MREREGTGSRHRNAGAFAGIGDVSAKGAIRNVKHDADWSPQCHRSGLWTRRDGDVDGLVYPRPDEIDCHFFPHRIGPELLVEAAQAGHR